MRTRTALNIVFEAAGAVACFAVSWSSYGHAVRADAARPDTNAMAAAFFVAGAIALFMLVRSLLASRRPPQ